MFNLAHPLEFLTVETWWAFNVLSIVLLFTMLMLPSTRIELRLRLRQNLWLILTFACVLLWLIRAHLLMHLHLHLLGVSLAYLLLGSPLALCAMATVLFVVDFTLHFSLYQFGLQFLLTVLLPVWTAQLLHTLIERLFAQRLFIFIFVHGFFIAALTMLITVSVNLWLLHQLDFIVLNAGDEVFWYSPLFLGWGEGLLSGMAVALIATYQPNWWFKNRSFMDF